MTGILQDAGEEPLSSEWDPGDPQITHAFISSTAWLRDDDGINWLDGRRNGPPDEVPCRAPPPGSTRRSLSVSASSGPPRTFPMNARRVGSVLVVLVSLSEARVQAPARIGSMDRDGDGKISKAEFTADPAVFTLLDRDED